MSTSITGHRRSIRLPSYDYSTPGAYFVTICVQDRRPIFADAEMVGLTAKAWNWLPQRFPLVALDEFVTMPEHLHFVIWLLDGADRRGGHLAAQGAQQRAPTLGSVVGAFKTAATRSINAHRGTIGQQVWQRNYFEHIIRTEDELRRICEYIQHNPLESHHHISDDLSEAWAADPE